MKTFSLVLGTAALAAGSATALAQQAPSTPPRGNFPAATPTILTPPPAAPAPPAAVDTPAIPATPAEPATPADPRTGTAADPATAATPATAPTKPAGSADVLAPAEAPAKRTKTRTTKKSR